MTRSLITIKWADHVTPAFAEEATRLWAEQMSERQQVEAATAFTPETEQPAQVFRSGSPPEHHLY